MNISGKTSSNILCDGTSIKKVRTCIQREEANDDDER